jgi:lysine 2,3-aminomutase
VDARHKAGHDGGNAMNAAPKTLRHLSELSEAGLAPAGKRVALEKVAAQYAVAITPAIAELIDPLDPHDPIARQFVPDAAELDVAVGEIGDPIGDHAHSPVAGIVHRYPDRLLLKLTSVCAVYCRFCFRREMIGPGAQALTRAQLAAALGYIASHPEIWEVILSGGDPLVLSARRLRDVIARLAEIPHVKVLRVHTRVPVADPDRITPELVRALKAFGKAAYVVLHANHARELSPAAREACARMVDAGIPMLSQSVLLKGVNDDPESLATLMRALVECRIKPYYVHHGDMAPGTSHLRTSIEHGQELMRGLRGHVSGLCQPSYMLDIPGGHGKSPIGPSYLGLNGDGRHRVEDYRGGVHHYPPST